MLDDETSTTTESPETTTTPAAETEAQAPAKKTAARKTAAKKTAAKKTAAKKTAAKKAPAKKTAARKTAAAPAEASAEATAGASAEDGAEAPAAPAKKTAAKKTAAKKTAAKKTAAKRQAEPQPELPLEEPAEEPTVAPVAAEEEVEEEPAAAAPVAPVALVFQAPEAAPAPRRTRKAAAPKPAPEPEGEAEATTEEPPAPKQTRTRQPKAKPAPEPEAEVEEAEVEEAETETEAETGEGEPGAARRRRRRGGRRRRKAGDGDTEAGDENDEDEAESGESPAGDDTAQGEGGGTRRRRVRVRAGETGGQGSDEPNTVTRVRQTRSPEDQITSVSGSTRLEAKKQRRREGREAGRRRAPIVSEAEFLARRESVDRVMVVRQHEDLTQIAVLEDKVLVEHYVARESQTSLIGNVYVGRVQNVLPSMEAAFIDIGKGRNAVLYAGEVNWSALGHKEGQPRKIESVLSSGQSVLVQVTKDPVGHKGARLTSQVSLAGRFLVYVPDGTTSGISRKLPDTERTRLKTLLKEIVPDTAGVIVRTAAEGASEEELTRDVERLKARWEDIDKGATQGNSAPKLLYGEPDLTLKVVRDLFTEDFGQLVIQGDEAWETVQQYVGHVAPDLQDRLERYDAAENGDVFAAYRIDEQIAKGLDRKVWLPSGGSLIIDRTEAMTVVDVNTGKFTGSGGNLEETVTKNNLEAAEEIVRQLRLRDIGGIIVVDFIDMVLESNRDLVLRRLVECLGRDRTRHQVAEVTSLGLVQMTRKRIGTGLLEAFSESCEHCQGRGLIVHDMPVEQKKADDGADRRGGGRRNRGRGGAGGGQPAPAKPPTPKDLAAVARPENADRPPLDEALADEALVGEALVDGALVDGALVDGALVDGASAVDTEPAEARPTAEARAEEPAAVSAVSPATEPVEEPVDGAAAVAAEDEVTAESVELPAEQAEAAPEEAAEPQPTTEAAAEPEPAPVAPAAPRVITRTRRAASRPAGAGVTTLEPVAIVVPEAPAEPEHAPVVEPPKVITRTRRVASRPAGASAAVDAAADGVAADAAPGEHAEDHHLELHVPIKKKGARKR